MFSIFIKGAKKFPDEEWLRLIFEAEDYICPECLKVCLKEAIIFITVPLKYYQSMKITERKHLLRSLFHMS